MKNQSKFRKYELMKNYYVDELEKYLHYEGIYGYLDAILDVLSFGKDSIHYSKEIEEEE